MALENDQVRFKFDLSLGTYRILDQGQPVISDARLKINDWSSDDPGLVRSFEQRDVTDQLGEGLALDLPDPIAAF